MSPPLRVSPAPHPRLHVQTMCLAVPTPSSSFLQCCGGHEDEHCLVWRAVRGCHTLPFTVHRRWRIWVQRCPHWSAQTQQRLVSPEASLHISGCDKGRGVCCAGRMICAQTLQFGQDGCTELVQPSVTSAFLCGNARVHGTCAPDCRHV